MALFLLYVAALPFEPACLKLLLFSLSNIPTTYLLAGQQGALIEFENIISMEPRNFVGDNFSRITPIYKVTQYNMACCYSMLGQVRDVRDILLPAAALALFFALKEEGLVPANAKP